MSVPRLDRNDKAAVAEFIEVNARPMRPPLVPEILLHLAEESVPIWQKTEEELKELNVPPPYWAFAWAGGQALARYLIDHPQLSRGKTVVDLGSGSGLAAIAAAKAGAKTVLAADIEPMALIACRLNAEANGVALAVTGDDLLARPAAGAELILIGDLFYERELAERVLAYIASAPSSAVVLIGDPERSYFPCDRFVRLQTYEVPVTRDLEDAEIKKTTVWRA